MKVTECIKCGSKFTYSETFYKNRGFKEPKRCPKCLGKKSASVILNLPSVSVEVPDECLGKPTMLSRMDAYTGEWYVSGVRYKLWNESVYMYLYDQVHKSKSHISGERYSLRVMRNGNKEYIVLDYPSNPLDMGYKLVYNAGSVSGHVIWEFGNFKVVKQ